MSSIVYGGLDVHQEWISAYLLCSDTGEVVSDEVRNERQALCYRGGLLQPVRIPSEAEETVRAVVRLHDTMTRDMTRAKNRVRQYLALLGWHYRGSGRWGPAHRAWIDHLPLNADQRLVVQSHLDALDELTVRRAEVDARIAELAAGPAYVLLAQRLTCLRGIDLYSAMVLGCEIGDIRRFWRLAQRKDPKTAAVAVARELAGVVWAILKTTAA